MLHFILNNFILSIKLNNYTEKISIFPVPVVSSATILRALLVENKSLNPTIRGSHGTVKKAGS